MSLAEDFPIVTKKKYKINKLTLTTAYPKSASVSFKESFQKTTAQESGNETESHCVNLFQFTKFLHLIWD